MSEELDRSASDFAAQVLPVEMPSYRNHVVNTRQKIPDQLQQKLRKTATRLTDDALRRSKETTWLHKQLNTLFSNPDIKLTKQEIGLFIENMREGKIFFFESRQLIDSLELRFIPIETADSYESLIGIVWLVPRDIKNKGIDQEQLSDMIQQTNEDIAHVEKDDGEVANTELVHLYHSYRIQARSYFSTLVFQGEPNVLDNPSIRIY